MKKLKLDLDQLKVESFETTPDLDESNRGTVLGYNGFPTGQTLCDGPCNTCDITCGNTCGNTCGGTCGATFGVTCGSACDATNSLSCLCTNPICP